MQHDRFNPTSESDIERLYAQQLFVMLGVCQAWRVMILEDRVLWSCIRESYIALTPEFIERSGLMSLTVHFMWFVPFNYQIDYPSLIWKPAPILTHFGLAGGNISSHPSGRTLLNAILPNLTLLIMCRAQFPWDLPLLRAIPTLTTLHISKVEETLTLRQLLEILQTMPHLQDLELLGVLPEPVGQFDELPRVGLPDLHSLKVGGTASACATFLSLVTFKDIFCHFKVACKDDFQGDSPLLLRPWLSGIIDVSAQHALSIRSLKLGMDAEETWYTTTANLFYQEQDTSTLVLCYQRPRGPHNVLHPLVQLFSLLECKKFTCQVAQEDSEWDFCAQHLPYLEDIELSGSYILNSRTCSSLLQRLTPVDSSQASAARLGSDSLLAQIAFRELKSLEIDHIFEVQAWDHFESILRERKAMGFGLGHLAVGFASDWKATPTAEIAKNIIEQGNS